ncbi:hypothetical protein FQZ97_1105680 [compost metagenome]
MESFGNALDRLPLRIDALIANTPITIHRPTQARHRKTTFPALLHLLAERRDQRVEQDGLRHSRGIRIAFAVLEAEDHQLQVDTDLRRSQTDTAGVAHGVEHVVDQVLQLGAAEQLLRHRRRNAQQALVTHLQDFADHIQPHCCVERVRQRG